ncbi:MAG: helix-turn-helix transcriptional regulator [Clostridia bacterium]|nr:helix-turn-helix transcriptional regulator [Clostridia bacterium]
MKIGRKIKDRRHQLGLTQKELADRCELTKGYISQLENDLTSPSIATLNDIVSALGITLQEFFQTESPEKIVYKKGDYILKEQEGLRFTWLIPSAQKNEMEPAYVELAPGATTEVDIPHEGEEFGFVLEGKILLTHGSRKVTANKGESFYFVSDKTHHITNPSKDKTAKVLWISSPPNF